ncbi:S-adenosyl-L-methionine-dependent methyltransferases superfamily protein [Euphorbia peplus]|nr:S-adenosyl-L-methionine-dependent methyltransferases superfamily protein [Euphorbia peplus]
MVESYPMNGGNGIYSYSKNSSSQREGIINAKSLIDETVSEKLEIGASKTFHIADLGCSVGPNAFLCVENIIQAVKLKYRDHEIPEFHVFFNDHTSNDFNTLFQSLPPVKPYFAAGVPGSFHERLFPENSINLFHSSSALHWLSHVPKELLDTNSPAWNKGRIFYAGASEQVIRAYAAQFAKDVEIFLNVRAKEVVEGGIMVLILSAGAYSTAQTFNILGSCFMDMAKEGTVSESAVDSFNVPIYVPTTNEVLELVEGNGCFNIEKIELFNHVVSDVDHTTTIGNEWAMQLRAIAEGVVSKYFGNEIMDELFDRFSRKAQEIVSPLQMATIVEEKHFMFLALKRNSSHL